jgi:predicted nucleic acid-binding protein
VDCAVCANARYIVSNDKHFDILEAIDFPKVDILTLEEFKEIIQ